MLKDPTHPAFSPTDKCLIRDLEARLLKATLHPDSKLILDHLERRIYALFCK